jgi:hypothetical protein
MLGRTGLVHVPIRAVSLAIHMVVAHRHQLGVMRVSRVRTPTYGSRRWQQGQRAGVVQAPMMRTRMMAVHEMIPIRMIHARMMHVSRRRMRQLLLSVRLCLCQLLESQLRQMSLGQVGLR